jgi:dipeptidyl aminopeptidase/acylaminoacyl peptidase
MQRFTLTAAVLLFHFIDCFAQLPNTDIWLLDIQTEKDSIILTNPVNITDRKGYDNQPSFSPDGKYILYTSMRDEKQSDIYKYDLKTKTITQFTNTSTSEYSPMVTPDGKSVSVVMVEPDSTQRLWKFPIKGGEPSVIMKDVDSIGYYCWLTKDRLALVMTTEPQILNVVGVKNQETKLFVNNVSRCIQRSPIKNKIGFFYSFRYKDSNKHWTLTNSYDQDTIVYTMLPLASQDYCVIRQKNKELIILYSVKASIIGYGQTSHMTKCNGDLSIHGITKITRIAVSPDGKKMAIVGESKN